MANRVLVPGLFVILWSRRGTWWSGSDAGTRARSGSSPGRRFGVAGAPPRGRAAAMVRAPWATRRVDYGHMALVGLLVHGIGLGGVWVRARPSGSRRGWQRS